MMVQDLPEWIDNELDFPAARSRVIEEAGGFVIEAPDRADSETLAAILERAGETTFQSREDLLDGIRGNLTDGYIGRKYYDDRGSNLDENGGGSSMDIADQSF